MGTLLLWFSVWVQHPAALGDRLPSERIEEREDTRRRLKELGEEEERASQSVIQKSKVRV